MSIRKEISNGIPFIIFINEMTECIDEGWGENNNSSFNTYKFQVLTLGFTIDHVNVEY